MLAAEPSVTEAGGVLRKTELCKVAVFVPWNGRAEHSFNVSGGDVFCCIGFSLFVAPVAIVDIGNYFLSLGVKLIKIISCGDAEQRLIVGAFHFAELNHKRVIVVYVGVQIAN